MPFWNEKEKIVKFIRVNMTYKTVSIEPVPDHYVGLGGRGLTSILINTEVPPTCDPLGPENKLVFAPGLLSGTPLVNTSRLSVGAKSPLTGGIKESNVGGTIGAALGRLGIAAIVIEGRASEGDYSLLTIDKKGKIALVDATAYVGMRTYACTEELLTTYGNKNSVVCIGTAGEFNMTLASIQASDVDGRPCRAAGRGGMGAVMGAKGLKALVVSTQGDSAEAIADPQTFKAAAKGVVKAIKAHPMSGQMMPELGTAGLVAPVNAMGAFPSYNARKGVLEGWEKISGEAMAETIERRGGKKRHMGCAQCIVHCSNEFVDESGGYVTSSLEYETIWALGGMTGVADLDIIAALDRKCDDIGVDTMNTGVAVAVAMDSGHGAFGDGAKVLSLVEEIGLGTEFGRLLGSGPVAVGKHFGNPRVPAVKNQSIAAYDPRAMKGNGVTYATCPMGADHTAGNVVGHYLEQKLDPLATEGQMETSRHLQIGIAAVDCTGMCFMAAIALFEGEGTEAFLKAINARCGTELSPEAIPALGVRVIEAERDFNRRAGFTKKDDRLPKFFYTEPLPPHNTVFDIKDEVLDATFNF
jgi:aldehyde:ferredoxin oxidoreductase